MALITPTTPLSIEIEKRTRDRYDKDYERMMLALLTTCGYSGAWKLRFKAGCHPPVGRIKLSSMASFGHIGIILKPGDKSSATEWTLSHPKEYTTDDVRRKIKEVLDAEAPKQSCVPPELLLTKIHEEATPPKANGTLTPWIPLPPVLLTGQQSVPKAPPAPPTIPEEATMPDPDSNATDEAAGAAMTASCGGVLADEEALAICFIAMLPHLNVDNCISRRLACDILRRELGLEKDAAGRVYERKVNIAPLCNGMQNRQYIIIYDDTDEYELTRRARDLAVKYGGMPARRPATLPATVPATVLATVPATQATGNPMDAMAESMRIFQRLDAAKDAKQRRQTFITLNQPKIAELEAERAKLQKKLANIAADITKYQREIDNIVVPTDAEIAEMEAAVAPIRQMVQSIFKEAK